MHTKSQRAVAVGAKTAMTVLASISTLILIIGAEEVDLPRVLRRTVAVYQPNDVVTVLHHQGNDSFSDEDLSGVKGNLNELTENATFTASFVVEGMQNQNTISQIITSPEPCATTILTSPRGFNLLEGVSSEDCHGPIKAILAFDTDNSTTDYPNLELIPWRDLEDGRGARERLSGRTIRTVYDEYFPYFFSSKNADGSMHFDGYFYRVAMIVADRLNVTVEYVPNTRDPGIWGYRTSNGSWNGMMAMVVDREVDMAGPGFFRHPERDAAVDFSVNVVDTKFVLFTQRNSRNQISIKNYLYEFDWEVWVLIALTSMALCLAFLVSFKIWSNAFHAEQSTSAVLRGLVYKGTSVPTRRYSMKFLMLVNLVFASVIVISYRSCLNAFLTIQVPVSSVRTFEDIKSTGKALTFWKGGLMEGILSASAEGTVERKLYDDYLKDEKAQTDSYEEGIANVAEDEGYVFVGPSMLGGVAPCNVTQVPNYVFKSWLICFTFQKGSPFTKYFNQEILALRQEGILDVLKERYFQGSHKECLLERESVSLTFDHVFTPFSLLAAGALAGAVFAVVEFLYNRTMDISEEPRLKKHRDPFMFQKVKTAEAVLSMHAIGIDQKFRLLHELFNSKNIGVKNS